jgi:hypothetical protein
MPARLLRRFVRKQQIVVQPVTRADGARKKRIIDAGPSDEPTTPTPAPKARAQLMRRGRGRGRANIAPSLPSIWTPSPSPKKMQSPSQLEHHFEASTEAPLPAPASSDIWAAASTPAQPIGQQSAHSPNSPKAWLHTSTPAKTQPSLFSCTTPPWLAAIIKKSTASPTPAPPSESVQHVSEDVDDDVDMDADESIEWSFEGAWTSPVPADQPANYLQPVAYPTIIIPGAETPPVGSPVASTPIVAATSALEIPRVHPPQESRRRPHQISPNTHMNIIRRASVTPLRKQLLKNQALAQGAFNLNIPQNSDHTVPAPSQHVPEQTELQQKVYQASNLKNHAAEVAFHAQEASEQYRSEAEARQNYTPEISAAEQQYYNYTETIDQDLSFLSDASDEEEHVPILQTTILSAPRNRSVRWSSHATAKPFYCDEKIADMLDSTLETIHSSPYRSPAIDHYSENDTSEDDSADASPIPKSHSNDGSSKQPDTPLKESVGFTGVPSSTWDDSDDSLDESQISIELLGDLQKEMQEKLALAPPPPPVKALVEPPSEIELDKINAAVTSTDNGRQKAKWIIYEKLNAHDFSTLLPKQFSGDPKAWLNDNIVNEYLGLLIAAMKKEAGFAHKRGGPAPAVHAFSSFWYPTFKKGVNGVARWAARFQLAGQQYLDAELLLYPICDVGHWRMLAVKPKERTIEYLDSLGWDGSPYLDAMRDYLAKELGDLWKEEEWTIFEKQRSTRQVNGSDCGVFAILNALALLRGEEYTKVLACDGMPDARERIAVTLLAGAPTTEFN